MNITCTVIYFAELQAPSFYGRRNAIPSRFVVGIINDSDVSDAAKKYYHRSIITE